MAATKKILVSLHGRRCGLSQDGKLVVDGKTLLAQNDGGVLPLLQATPGTLNATGTLTAALVAAKIVTSTTAAATTATLDTGTAMDTALAADVAIGEAIEFAVINTGVSDFVVTAAAGHTLVGNMVVAPKNAGYFRSKRTAANTWVTYGIGFASDVVVQNTPGTLNATGALTAALIYGKIVTSTTAAAVVATVDTGTAMDTALAAVVPIGTGFEWSAVATGANSFTVTAAAGHTLEGSGVVATVTSGRFFSRRTAANTWVTTRLA